MSIFSAIRKTRKEAKDQNAKLAEQKKKEEVSLPYRHVPTHAATDAFASAPPRWREAADRARIIEHNQRRSTIAAGSSHVSLPSATVPRIGSGLSYVSFPGNPMSLRARMPKSYSYGGVSPYSDSSRDVIYSAPNGAYAKPAAFREQWHTESTSDETSSQEELEIRNSQRESSSRPQASKDTPHRLHPAGRSRRASDASLDRRVGSNAIAHKTSVKPNSPRDSRPPPSMRGFAHTPPTMSLVPVQPHSISGQLSGDVAAPNSTQLDVGAAQSTKSSRHQSTSSLPGLMLDHTRKAPVSGPSSPLAFASSVADDYLDAHTAADVGTSSSPKQDSEVPTESVEEAAKVQSETKTPAANLSPMPSNLVTPWEDHPVNGISGTNKVEVVNTFPERASEVEFDKPSKGKTRRFSKGGGKLLRKHRD